MTVSRWLLGAALAGVVAIAGCGKPSTEEVETETVVPVSTAPAETGNIRAVIHATGDVNPQLGAELIVVAPEPARIAAITKRRAIVSAAAKFSCASRFPI
jgi:multidrug efflux pump subunit AcrA (membrane-fusion protein)